jgi:hypothetical protein
VHNNHNKLKNLRRNLFVPKQITVASTLFALVLAALPARADKPTIQVNPFPAEGLIAPTAAPELCGFDILAVLQDKRPNGTKVVLFSNGGNAGTGIATGSLFLTLTNLNTGKTANVNVGGPSKLEFSDDGTLTLVGLGHGIVAFPPAPRSVTLAAGLPAVPLLYGKTTFKIDAQGNVTDIQDVHGTVQDVCALLR